MASTVNISPEQMAECWEAFSINRNVKELNEVSFKSYREQLIKDCSDDSVLRKVTEAGAVIARPSLKHKADALPTVTPPAKRLSQQQRNNTTDSNKSPASNQQLPASFSSSDKNRRISLSPGRPVPSSSMGLTPSHHHVHSYAQRQGSGDVVFSYRPESMAGMEIVPATNKAAPKCQVRHQHFDTNVQTPYRRFFTSTADRAQALDRQLLELGQDICERFGLNTADETGDSTDVDPSAIAGLEAVGVPRQVKVTNIGRICNAVRDLDIIAAAVSL